MSASVDVGLPEYSGPMTWNVEFFADDRGRVPAREFLRGLDAPKRMAMIAAIECILEEHGIDVCRTEYGRQLGGGLFEFRLRHDERTVRRKAGRPAPDAAAGESVDVLLRMFCHAYGDKVILLLGGYDKGEDPSTRRQSREIAEARKRRRSFQLRRQPQAKGERRRGPKNGSN